MKKLRTLRRRKTQKVISKMSYYVYMLKEKSSNTTYVGYTKNLNERIKLHNKGKGAKFTRGRKWKLIYKEKFKTKRLAILRENYIKKNRKLRNYIIDNFL